MSKASLVGTMAWGLPWQAVLQEHSVEGPNIAPLAPDCP